MYAATVLGPVVAFIGGGFLLKLYTHFNTVDNGHVNVSKLSVNAYACFLKNYEVDF